MVQDLRDAKVQQNNGFSMKSTDNVAHKLPDNQQPGHGIAICTLWRKLVLEDPLIKATVITPGVSAEKGKIEKVVCIA